MKGCGGYILIKSKWFQSNKSLEITGTLPILIPHQGFVLQQSRVSKPLSNGLLKSVLLKYLWMRHCNGYSLQQRTKISKTIKTSSTTDNSARNFCHICDLLHKKKTLLLNLNPIILNLVKPRLFYGGCSLQNKIKIPRTSVQKVTQNKIKKARI